MSRVGFIIHSIVFASEWNAFNHLQCCSTHHESIFRAFLVTYHSSSLSSIKSNRCLSSCIRTSSSRFKRDFSVIVQTVAEFIGSPIQCHDYDTPKAHLKMLLKNSNECFFYLINSRNSTTNCFSYFILGHVPTWYLLDRYQKPLIIKFYTFKLKPFKN